MDEKKSMELTKEQLDEVVGGIWDEENGFGYFEGTVVDMGGRTAFVRIYELFCEKECTYDRALIKFSINSRVRVRWPERVIYRVI